MILYINYNINSICKSILQEQLEKLNLKYELHSLGEVEIKEKLSDKKLNELNALLNQNHIEIVESQKSILVKRIKEAIVEMVFMEEKLPLKTSEYLSEKLKKSYVYLSNVFSSVTYTSIENFILLQKTERAKQLLSMNELNVSEISYILNYSSTAHFGNQFKKITGLTPIGFQRIMNKRKDLKNGY